MTQPKSRNAVDGVVSPWNESVPEEVPFMFWCAAPDASTVVSLVVSTSGRVQLRRDGATVALGVVVETFAH